MSINSQVVVITGAARGIGYGIAESFAEQGDRLVIADVDDNCRWWIHRIVSLKSKIESRFYD